MKVDFSEPKCSNCFYHQTSGIRNTQETEPGFSFGPFQVAGHDSASVGSLSTSSLTTTTPSAPPAIASVSSMTSGFALPIGTPTSSFGFGPPISSRSISSTEPTQSLGQEGFGIRDTAAPATTTFSTSSPIHSSSLFGPVPAVTSVSSASTQAPVRSLFASAPAVTLVSSTERTNSPFGSGTSPLLSSGSNSAFATPSLFGSPVQASSAFATSPPFEFLVQASSASGTSSPFSCRPAQDSGKTASVSPFGFARPDVAITLPVSNQSTNTIFFGTTPVSVPSLLPPSIPKSPFSSSFPGFGDSYLPGTVANPSRFTPFGAGGGSVSAATPFGFSECSRPNVEGSRHTRYAPTPDFELPSPGGHLMVSISASEAYRCKSHEELRWEDYKNGDKGGSNPAAHIFPIGSRPSAVLTPSTVSPSIFASDSYKSHEELRREAYKTGVSVPAAHISPIASGPSAFFSTPSTVSPSIFAPRGLFDQAQRTTQGNMNGSIFDRLPSGPLISPSSGFNPFPTSSSTPSTTIPAAPLTSSVQRPHETNDVSSRASGCTACGATSSSSASVYSAFNGPATPTPAAATSSLPGPFFSIPGSFPMMFGGMAPAFQAYPMMFGTNNLPVQGTTTPAIQACPVQGFLLLPFAAMNLQ